MVRRIDGAHRIDGARRIDGAHRLRSLVGTRPAVAGVALMGAVVMAGAGLAVRQAAQPSEVPTAYVQPVVAPVVDGFRPPQTFAGTGNRGLEYLTVGGEDVASAAAGIVVFSGPVAGSQHITVQHGDGIRTSYSHLTSRTAVFGDRVIAGQILGTANVGFHLGARIGETYLDPALLLAAPETEPSGRAWLIRVNDVETD